MAYQSQNTNGQKTMANSSPIVIASDQSTIPVSNASLPLPTGASTSALQTTGNTSVASIDTKTPALGQALAAASVPVVLTAAQVTTLTPPAAITGFATETTLGTRLSESDFDTKTGSLTETAPTTDTASSGVNGRLQRIAQRITSLITALGSPFQAGGSIGNTSFGATQATAANLNATVVGTGTFVTQSTLAAETTKVIGTVNQGTSPWVTSNATTSVVGNGAAATAQRVTLANDSTGIIGTVSAVTAITNALPAGTNLMGKVGIDQTTVGTTNAVSLAQVGATTVATGNGVVSAGVQRVAIASDNTAFPIKFDQTTPGTTNAVSLAQIGGTTIVNGGLAGSQSVGGTVATNVAITDNPINNGGQAISAENTAVTTGRKVQFVADLTGKQIILPYANPENFVKGTTGGTAGTTYMTLTTSTAVTGIGAPGAGLFNYITQVTVLNQHATVGTNIILQDGSAGNSFYAIPAAAVFGGATITFPVPIKQPTANLGLFCANTITGASTIVSASGYIGK